MELPGISTRIKIDTNPFKVGLGDAMNLAGKFATDVKGKLSGLGEGAFGALQGAAGAGMQAAGQVAIGALRKVGEEIVSVSATIARQVSETFTTIDAIGKSANSFGMAVEQYTALGFAAKQANIDQAALSQSMRVMTNNLADAAMGAGQAGKAIEKMGLDSLSLVNASPDEAFKKIADGLKSIQNPMERTQVAMDIFGKQAGPGLMNLLASGSEGIQKQMDRAKALGVTFNDIDFQKVQAANSSLAEVGATIQGALQQGAIALAPYIEDLTKRFTEAAIAGGGFGQYAVSAVEAVAKAIAVTADYVGLYITGWQLEAAVFAVVVSDALKGIDAIGSALVKLINLIPGVNIAWTDSVKYLSEGFDERAKELMDSGMQGWADFNNSKYSTAVTKFFNDIKTASQQNAEEAAKNANKMGGAYNGMGEEAVKQIQKIDDALAEMNKKISQFGMTDLEKQMDDFAKMAGNTKEKIDAFNQAAKEFGRLKAGEFLKDMEKDLRQFGMNEFDKQRDNIRNNRDLNDTEKQRAMGIVDQREKQSQMKDFDAKVKNFAESIKTPMEKFTEQMDFLQEALALGKITEQQFDLGAGKARADAFGEEKLPALIRSGSAESFAARYDAGRPKSDIQLNPQVKAIKEGNSKVVDKLDELKTEIIRSRTPVMDMP